MFSSASFSRGDSVTDNCQTAKTKISQEVALAFHHLDAPYPTGRLEYHPCDERDYGFRLAFKHLLCRSDRRYFGLTFFRAEQALTGAHKPCPDMRREEKRVDEVLNVSGQTWHTHWSPLQGPRDTVDVHHSSSCSKPSPNLRLESGRSDLMMCKFSAPLNTASWSMLTHQLPPPHRSSSRRSNSLSLLAFKLAKSTVSKDEDDNLGAL